MNLQEKKIAQLEQRIKELENELQHVKFNSDDNAYKFKKFFSTIPDGAYIASANDGICVDLNDQFAEIFGYTKEEIIGKNPVELGFYYDPLQREELVKAIQKDGFVKSFEVKARKKDGSVFWASFSISLLELSGKLYAFGVIRDISLEKTRIEELQLSKLRAEKSQQRINEQQLEISNFFNYIIDLLCIADFEGRFLRLSKEWENLLGYSMEDLTGKKYIDFVHPDDVQMTIEANNKLSSNNSVISFKNRYLCKDGSYKWLEWKSHPFGDKVFATARDITERVSIEKQLIAAKLDSEKREHEIRLQKEEIEFNNERLESLLRISQFSTGSSQELLDFALKEAIELTKSKIGYIYFYNENTHQFTLNTWSKEVMDECKVANPQTQYDLDKTGCWGDTVRLRKPIIINDYQSAGDNKKGIPQGHVSLQKFMTIPVIFDQKIVAVAGIANKETDYNSSDVRQLTLLMDNVWKISERIALIENLQSAKITAEESEKQFRQLFENMEQGFALHEMIYDDEGNPTDYRFYLINKAFEKLTGTEASVFLNRTVKELLPTIEPFWIEQYGMVAKTGKSLHFENFAKEFNKYYDVVAYSPKKDFFAVIFTDITKNKLFEQDLINAKEKAEESDRLKSAFLQNMSHEVRTPLNAIAGFSELLARPSLKQEKIATFSELIAENSQKLIDIITDVIEISQIQAHQLHINVSKIDLVAISKNVIRKFSHKAKLKNIILNTSFQKDAAFEIYSDEDKLYRIISHIVDNALKFTIEGSVTLKWVNEGDFISLEVQDTGIGISSDMQEVVFEPFRQIETGSVRNYGGNGLGLTLVKAYLELLNGSVSLKSELNKGTVVSILFPINNNSIKEIASSIKARKIKKVLIAEDEYANYLYLCEILSEFGFDIVYAENGKVAVDIVKEDQSIGLVLMDIKMPIMDGHAAANLIKSINTQLPIIAQSAYAMENEREKFAGIFDDYITKPIKPEVIRKTLQKYILI